MKILKFKYFLFNDTYLAEAESHLSDMEELEELMPIGRPDLEFVKKPEVPSDPSSSLSFTESKLDAFFRDERKEAMKRDISNKTEDTLTLAEKVGLL